MRFFSSICPIYKGFKFVAVCRGFEVWFPNFSVRREALGVRGSVLVNLVKSDDDKMTINPLGNLGVSIAPIQQGSIKLDRVTPSAQIGRNSHIHGISQIIRS